MQLPDLGLDEEPQDPADRAFAPTRVAVETPVSAAFLRRLQAMEATYVSQDSPLRQCGFSGNETRWKEQRFPIMQAIEGDGDLLNLGCANGYLLESLVSWAEEKDVFITPHGLDAGTKLISYARARHNVVRTNFHVGNAWDWEPPRKYRYVYTSTDLVQPEFLAHYLMRVKDVMVEVGGRLIVGAYGSRRRAVHPLDLRVLFDEIGWRITGMSSAPGEASMPVIARFAWMNVT
jgi:hypothetical protein